MNEKLLTNKNTDDIADNKVNKNVYFKELGLKQEIMSTQA